jgi:hypothetical protein
MKQSKRRVRRKLWTPVEITTLKRLAGTLPAAKIARRLRRSPAAVTFKAHIQGISLRVQ